MRKFFSDKEMECHCCHFQAMDPDFMDRLNTARELAGIPFHVTSGFRCLNHNLEVGSASTNHTTGKAVDIKCNNAQYRCTIVSALITAGFTGLGVGKDFIHCDTNHDTGMLWLY